MPRSLAFLKRQILASGKNLNKLYIEWTTVLTHFSIVLQITLNLFTSKVLMKIKRYSPNCSLCQSTLETLPHIFLQCPDTHTFKSRPSAFITLKLYDQYHDRNNYHFITCNHVNSIINNILASSPKTSNLWTGLVSRDGSS